MILGKDRVPLRASNAPLLDLRREEDAKVVEAELALVHVDLVVRVGKVRRVQRDDLVVPIVPALLLGLLLFLEALEGGLLGLGHGLGAAGGAVDVEAAALAELIVDGTLVTKGARQDGTLQVGEVGLLKVLRRIRIGHLDDDVTADHRATEGV